MTLALENPSTCLRSNRKRNSLSADHARCVDSHTGRIAGIDGGRLPLSHRAPKPKAETRASSCLPHSRTCEGDLSRAFASDTLLTFSSGHLYIWHHAPYGPRKRCPEGDFQTDDITFRQPAASSSLIHSSTSCPIRSTLPCTSAEFLKVAVCLRPVLINTRSGRIVRPRGAIVIHEKREERVSLFSSNDHKTSRYLIDLHGWPSFSFAAWVALISDGKRGPHPQRLLAACVRSFLCDSRGIQGCIRGSCRQPRVSQPLAADRFDHRIQPLGEGAYLSLII